MSKLRIYLAGGINGLSDADCKDWRAYATKYLSDQFEIIDPMSRDYRGMEYGNENEIVTKDKHDIYMSHFVLAMCKAASWGTAMEIEYAHAHQIPVIGVCDLSQPVSPWLRYHCRCLMPTLSSAVTLIQTKGLLI